MDSIKTVGIWILITCALLILIMLLFGQTMSFINYDFTVSLGLQEPIDNIGEFGVVVNKGFGIGDTLIYLPLLLVGIIGVWKKKKWGAWTMFGALAITTYWPVVSLSIVLLSENVASVQFNNLGEYIIVLSAIAIYGLWGMYYIYKNQNMFSN